MIEDLLQRGLLSQLDIEVGITKLPAQQFGEDYAHRTLAGPGHADQAYGVGYVSGAFHGVVGLSMDSRHYPFAERPRQGFLTCAPVGHWLEWPAFGRPLRTPKTMTLQTTPLDSLHRELGAKMVPFAGYDMPVQYPAGIIKEHLQTRACAGLFDVSHMGQVIIEGAGAAAGLESLVPVDVQGLADNGQTYALFTNDDGGVQDDLIITRWAQDRYFLVVNAACKAQDIAHLRDAPRWPCHNRA